MKRMISEDDEKFYTYMLKVIQSIDDDFDCNWLITDIDAYPSNKETEEMLNTDYLFLSHKELLSLLEKEDFQWVWAIFSAIRKDITRDDILQYPLPNRENASFDDSIFTQHPLAEIEIDCMDSSYFQIIVKDDKILKNFKKSYPKATEY